MKEYNCPNCGAPRTGDKCEYCGTVFCLNFENKRLYEEDEDKYIEIYADNKIIERVKKESPMVSFIKEANIAVLPEGVEFDCKKNVYKLSTLRKKDLKKLLKSIAKDQAVAEKQLLEVGASINDIRNAAGLPPIEPTKRDEKGRMIGSGLRKDRF